MKTVKVWDPFVRIFHWTLVAAVISQLVTAEDVQWLHVRVGYALLILLGARIVWGLVGTRHARFRDFIYPPSEVFSYLRGLFKGRPRHYIGHNPAGGAMVCALIATLSLTCFAGLMTQRSMGHGLLAGPETIFTPLAYADEDNEDDDDEHNGNHPAADVWKEIHEFMVGLVIFLGIVHICGVLASSWVHRENLIKAMITGRKQVTEDD